MELLFRRGRDIDILLSAARIGNMHWAVLQLYVHTRLSGYLEKKKKSLIIEAFSIYTPGVVIFLRLGNLFRGRGIFISIHTSLVKKSNYQSLQKASPSLLFFSFFFPACVYISRRKKNLPDGYILFPILHAYTRKRPMLRVYIIECCKMVVNEDRHEAATKKIFFFFFD